MLGAIPFLFLSLATVGQENTQPKYFLNGVAFNNEYTFINPDNLLEIVEKKEGVAVHYMVKSYVITFLELEDIKFRSGAKRLLVNPIIIIDDKPYPDKELLKMDQTVIKKIEYQKGLTKKEEGSILITTIFYKKKRKAGGLYLK